MTSRLKIFGERNCGTNYLQKLAYDNLEVAILGGGVPVRFSRTKQNWFREFFFFLTAKRNLGWKHGVPNINHIKKFKHADSLHIVTITKNPYSFLLSLYKRPYHYVGEKPSTFQEFLESPWILQNRDGINKKKLDSPVELWNYKNAAYLGLQSHFDFVSNIRYEDLLSKPETIFKQVCSDGGIEVKSFHNAYSSTKKSNMTYEDYANYYLNELWKSKLNVDSINVINGYLDYSLVEKFGYQIIDA